MGSEIIKELKELILKVNADRYKQMKEENCNITVGFSKSVAITKKNNPELKKHFQKQLDSLVD